MSGETTKTSFLLDLAINFPANLCSTVHEIKSVTIKRKHNDLKKDEKLIILETLNLNN